MSVYSATEKKIMLEIARKSVEEGVLHNRPYKPVLKSLPPCLTQTGAAFCTLRLNGSLRGCIGSVEAHELLALDIAQNAYLAAKKDFRFSPLTKDEMQNVEIELSILQPMKPLPPMTPPELSAYLAGKKPGVVVEKGNRRATFLPSVWKSLPGPEDFLRELKKKAGLDPHEHDDLTYYEYEAEKIA